MPSTEYGVPNLPPILVDRRSRRWSSTYSTGTVLTADDETANQRKPVPCTRNRDQLSPIRFCSQNTRQNKPHGMIIIFSKIQTIHFQYLTLLLQRTSLFPDEKGSYGLEVDLFRDNFLWKIQEGCDKYRLFGRAGAQNNRLICSNDQQVWYLGTFLRAE